MTWEDAMMESEAKRGLRLRGRNLNFWYSWWSLSGITLNCMIHTYIYIYTYTLYCQLKGFMLPTVPRVTRNEKVLIILTNHPWIFHVSYQKIQPHAVYHLPASEPALHASSLPFSSQGAVGLEVTYLPNNSPSKQQKRPSDFLRSKRWRFKQPASKNMSQTSKWWFIRFIPVFFWGVKMKNTIFPGIPGSQDPRGISWNPHPPRDTPKP